MCSAAFRPSKNINMYLIQTKLECNRESTEIFDEFSTVECNHANGTIPRAVGISSFTRYIKV